MNHLADAQIQALADGEGQPSDAAHAAGCAACRARIAERQERAAVLAGSIADVGVPPGTARRIDAALAGARAAGATRLRPAAPPRWRHAAWGTAGLAAATIAT